MRHTLYVCLQDDDRIAVFALDSDSGLLTPLESYAVGQRPSAILATSLGE